MCVALCGARGWILLACAREKPALSRVDQDVDKRTHRSFLGVASAS